MAMSCIGPLVGSCCATMACQACQCCAVGIANVSARVAYCTMFLLSMILSWILRDYAQPMMEKIPWIVRSAASYKIDSDVWYGQQAVYRVAFGNFVFFMALCLSLIGVKDRSEPRDKLHHGAWTLKFLAWIVCIVMPFFLPNPVLELFAFFARFGSGFFLIIQVVILLDFAAAWNESWASKESEKWLYALLAVTVACFTGSLTLIGLLYQWYRPHGDCSLNIFFITFTLLGCFAFSVVSIHPAVKGGSLMPSAVITAYCVYLCYSALSSEPASYVCNGIADHNAQMTRSALTMGMITTLFSVVYSALRAGSNASFFSVVDDENQGTLLSAPAVDDSDDEEGMTRGGGSRSGPVEYNYSFFHLIFALATMYTAMLMTGWANGAMGQSEIDVGWTSVWVKILSQWTTIGLYSWTLVAPALMPDRDFGY